MITLRPNQIFNQLSDNQRLAEVALPVGHSLTSMLERALVIAFTKIVNPERAFEFGTYRGESTYLIAANSNAQVLTIDLGKQISDSTKKSLDSYEEVNFGNRFIDDPVFKGHECEKRIERLFGDSVTYDFAPYFGNINLILIDGGHQIDVVRSDTLHAFQMLDSSRPGIIIWHDYLNPEYKITEYLDGLASEKRLYHIAESKYVFYTSHLSFD